MDPVMSKSKQTVVLFPSFGMGHLIPMVELAKLFVTRDFAVTIVVVDTPNTPPINSSFVSAVSSKHPSISFHHLPKLSPPHLPSHRLLANFLLLRLANPHLLHFLASLSRTSSVSALVLDMFCTAALDVTRGLGLQAYFFFPSSASALTTFVLTPVIQSQTASSFKDLGETPQCFPGLPPVPASHMPINLLDRGLDVYDEFSKHLVSLPTGDGIVINTFEALETRAAKALTDGSCFPGRPMPPVYCIGPLIADGNGSEKEKHECLGWLDAQPKGSVVFLSFGSLGSFAKEQVEEIGIGLERSKQRFLWVVRSPPSDDPAKRLHPRAEPDLDELLPEGFLRRTEGRGMVVKSWAPQAAVLQHESVGAFVSHCGWNSILEAVCAGVPIIAWPLYAEQKLNKVWLTEEVKLAVEMKGYDKELVSAEEVETKVRWMMESEGGKELKDRATAMKASTVAARKDGGSSDKAWMAFERILKDGRMQI